MGRSVTGNASNGGTGLIRAWVLIRLIHRRCSTWGSAAGPGYAASVRRCVRSIQLLPQLTAAAANQQPYHTAVKCSIEKAVWKLAQNGLSIAAKIYYYRIFYTSTFFSNGRISETKRDILDPLAPKWPQCIGLPFTLSWKKTQKEKNMTQNDPIWPQMI